MNLRRQIKQEAQQQSAFTIFALSVTLLLGCAIAGAAWLIDHMIDSCGRIGK